MRRQRSGERYDAQSRFFRFGDLDDFIRVTCTGLSVLTTRVQKRTVAYYNVPAAFDIETSSFRDDADQKVALMYVWQFGLNGHVIVGRTWEEFRQLCRRLHDELGLSTFVRLPVYVHFLPFEFQFLKSRFVWRQVFAIDAYDVLYAVSEDGLEFRCSAKLAGTSLEVVGDNLRKHQVKKLVGDLDYRLIRTPATELTDEELGYCVNDVLVVMAFIDEEIDRNGGKITKVPLTKTGYARRHCRERCLPYQDRKAWWKYRRLIEKLTLDMDHYRQLRRGFAGGFTHGAFDKIGRIQENVDSFDLTSAYPATIANKFPMGPGRILKKLTTAQFERLVRDPRCCCLFDLELSGVVATCHWDHYISKSKCWEGSGFVVDNGRVTRADRLCITVTNVDYDIICHFYKWRKRRVTNFRIYKADYLPRPLIETFLQLYADKTTLKGVSDDEIPNATVNYAVAKALLNSVYGMTVSRVLHETWQLTEDGEWISVPATAEDLEKNNESFGRFVYYPWGVWITAYVRRTIAAGILELGPDYVYSDTDCLKLLHADRHLDWIRSYNDRQREKLLRMCEAREIDPELIEPADPHGVRHLLGAFDWETEGQPYTRFKTLGAKRYMVEAPGALKVHGEKLPISITVSGVNKREAVPWMLSRWDVDGCFEHFNEGLEIPPEHTGKLTHTYINEPREGKVKDYRGRTYAYREESGVHLEPCGYSLSFEAEFAKALKAREFKINIRKEVDIE